MSSETAAPQPIHLTQLTQIAITVSDLARSTAFYRDILGLQFLFDAGAMAFLQCGGVRILLGLAEPGKSISTPATILYFEVDDLAATHAILQSLDVPFLQPPHLIAKMPSHDLWLAVLTDPDNNPVGLMSELPRSS